MPRAGASVVNAATKLRNFVINGNFDFWQRNTSFINVVNAYTSDRWFSWFNVADVTRESISDLLGSQFAMRVLARVGSVEANTLQAIETINVKPLIGKKATLSFYARKGASFDGEFRVYIGSSVTEIKESQVGNLFVSVDLASQLTANWQKFTFTTDIPVPGNALAMTISFRHSAVVTGGGTNYFELAQVMMNEGEFAAPFELAGGNFEGELSLCQRYFEKSYNLDVAPGTVDPNGRIREIASSSSEIDRHQDFATRKRAIPIMSYHNLIGVSSGPTTSQAGQTGFSVNGGASVGPSANYDYHWTADAEL